MNLIQEMLIMNENVVEVYQLRTALRIVRGQNLELCEEAIAKRIQEVKAGSEERWGVPWDSIVAIHNRGWLGVKDFWPEE